MPAVIYCPKCDQANQSADDRTIALVCAHCGELIPGRAPEPSTVAEPYLAESVGDQPSPSRKRSPVPGRIRAAGIIWVVFGILVIGDSIYGFVATIVMAKIQAYKQPIDGVQPRPGNRQAPAANKANEPSTDSMLFSLGLAYLGRVLFGIAFISVGVQCVKGKSKDTLGSAIGSFVLAGLCLLPILFVLGSWNNNSILILIWCLILAGGLMTAAILALSARADYRKWRIENGLLRNRRLGDVERDQSSNKSRSEK